MSVSGSFDVDVVVASVWFFGVERAPETVSGPGCAQVLFAYDTGRKALRVQIDARLDGCFEVTFS
jgi:hypothetical protein